MQSHRFLRMLFQSVAVVVALASSACKVTREDLDTWKGTVKGPGKIVAVMLADKYDMALRSHAALALVDMERQDVDGLAELERALRTLDDNTRKAIIDGMAPQLQQMMNAGGNAKEGDANPGPPPVQVRAKDAAYVAILLASQQTRNTLTNDLISWYVQDFQRRGLSGNYSVEQVVRRLGAPAAKVLVDALSPKLPQQTLGKVAELIGQLGDAPAKQNAGSRLVEIERTMEGDDFLGWVREEIRKQTAEGGTKVDEQKLQRAAEINRHSFIVDGALPAMKHLADQEEVARRLLELASAETQDPSKIEIRVRALQALEGSVQKKHLKPLLALALDEKNPVSVRDYAFDRVGDIRSPEAIPPMWPMVADEKQQRLRWRAGELVLAIGGNKVLAEFFSKLPSGKDVTYEPEELEGYASRMSQMNPLPTAMAKAQLESADWWDRVIAIKFFERRGNKDAVSKLEKLIHDKTEVSGKGWDKNSTVGKVAQDAIASVRERMKQATDSSDKNTAQPANR